MKKCFKLLLTAVLVLGGTLFGFQVNTTNVEASTVNEGYVTFEKLNESTLKLNVENGKSYINEEGIAFIEDDFTGQVAELPQEGIDKNGMPINMVYKADGNDLIVEYHSVIQPYGFWKCTLGTVGGAGTGALAGMGIGAMAGTPVTVLGGGVFGGLSGGMVGASSSCF